MSYNKLARINDQLKRLKNLKALILNNNEIKKMENIGHLFELNTLGKLVFVECDYYPCCLEYLDARYPIRESLLTLLSSFIE